MISHRADILRKIQDRNLLNITGYENYTPEICQKIKELFHQGLIDSYPYMRTSNSVEWYNKNGEVHRSNNLPATEFKYGGVSYCINGLYHRSNGPAIICPIGDIKSIEWYFMGKAIASATQADRFKQGDVSTPYAISFDEYKILIETNFPDAPKDKLKYGDWV